MHVPLYGPWDPIGHKCAPYVIWRWTESTTLLVQVKGWKWSSGHRCKKIPFFGCTIILAPAFQAWASTVLSLTHLATVKLIVRVISGVNTSHTLYRLCPNCPRVTRAGSITLPPLFVWKKCLKTVRRRRQYHLMILRYVHTTTPSESYLIPLTRFEQHLRSPTAPIIHVSLRLRPSSYWVQTGILLQGHPICPGWMESWFYNSIHHHQP